MALRSCSCDMADDHEHGRCASALNLPSPPALSVLDVPASQASSGVYDYDLRAAEIDELSCCAPSMRQAGSAEEPMRFCRRMHAAAHAGRLATDTFEAHAVLRVHV